jgi:hypothetical protein
MVESTVGMHEQDGEGEVEIEPEDREIDLSHVGNANTHVGLGDFNECSGRTGNLPIEGRAVLSGLSPEDQEERASFLGRLGTSLFQVGHPPEPIRVGLLGRGGGGTREKKDEEENRNSFRIHDP